MASQRLLPVAEPMERRQRRHKNNKAEATEAPATSVHDVPDDLLKLILLCLDSPLWLIRAACTCRRWHGFLAADGGAILRLARSTHPPAIAGHYHNRIGGPIAFVPSSPPVPIDNSRFSLDCFLPLADASKWKVADCHGGLVFLMERLCVLPDLVVCNPLTRRYRGIKRPEVKQACCSAGDAFLLDGDDGNISMSKFRVFYRFDVEGHRRACVFSTSDGWRFLQPLANALDGDWQVAGRVDRSLYLGSTTGSMLALDNATLEFSKINLPSHMDPSGPSFFSSFRVVHGAGPDPALPPTARIVHANGMGLEVFRRVHSSSGEWVLEHGIRRLSEVARGLPSYLAERPYHWVVKVIADGVGFAVLSVVDFGKRNWLFTVDVATMAVQFVPESSYHLYRGTTATSTYALPYVV